MNIGKIIACVLLLSTAAFAKKPVKPPPPPPPLNPTIYVNFGDIVPDNTANWGAAPYTFHPGLTPPSGVDAAGKVAIMDRMRAIISEGGFNLGVAEYTGQKMVLGQTEEVVLGGDGTWALWYFGATSGVHFYNSFQNNTQNAQSKAYSFATYYWPGNYDLIADSLILEGVTGPAGYHENLSIAGYANNFLQGEGWTPTASATYMQSVYGKAPSLQVPIASGYVIEPAYPDGVQGTGVTPVSVPEPSSLAWIAMGWLAFRTAQRARRRRGE